MQPGFFPGDIRCCTIFCVFLSFVFFLFFIKMGTGILGQELDNGPSIVMATVFTATQGNLHCGQVTCSFVTAFICCDCDFVDKVQLNPSAASGP